MTVPSATTVANLAREAVVKGWYPGGLTDQLVRKIGFDAVSMPGESIVWNRATSLPAVPFYTTLSSAFTATPMETTAFTGSFRRLGEVAEVDTFQELAAGDPNDQLAVQIEAKKVAAIRTLGAQIVQGTGATNLQGFLHYIPVGAGPQARDAVGGALTLELLHLLVSMVTASDGCVGAGADCLVAHERVVREVIRLGEQAPGGGICYEWDEDLGVRVPHFHGVPVYIGQEPDVTLLWAVKLRGPTGVRVLHANGRSSEFGLQVVPVPQQQNFSRQGAFVGGFYTLVVPEAQSLAKLYNFTILAPV